MACGLKFQWYLKTISPKFHKVARKIEVSQFLPCPKQDRLENFKSSKISNLKCSDTQETSLNAKSFKKFLNQLKYILFFRSWNRGPHVRPNPKRRLKTRVRNPESAKLQNQPTRKTTTRLRWKLLDPDVCAKFGEER